MLSTCLSSLMHAGVRVSLLVVTMIVVLLVPLIVYTTSHRRHTGWCSVLHVAAAAKVNDGAVSGRGGPYYGNELWGGHISLQSLCRTSYSNMNIKIYTNMGEDIYKFRGFKTLNPKSSYQDIYMLTSMLCVLNLPPRKVQINNKRYTYNSKGFFNVTSSQK